MWQMGYMVLIPNGSLQNTLFQNMVSVNSRSTLKEVANIVLSLGNQLECLLNDLLLHLFILEDRNYCQGVADFFIRAAWLEHKTRHRYHINRVM